MADMIIDKDDFWELKKESKYIGVTKRFQNVMKTFPMPCGETPAGFQRDYYLDGEGILRLDLRRNISYDKNGRLRPTKVLFSADSANPYEVAPISPFLANLTCNPGIVYDLFLNNPKANVGNQFKTREEVMKELAKILGPGCDISVELNNPFEEDFQKILEEAEVFKEIFTEYRVVIKVPHTGVVTGANVSELLKGNKRLKSRYDQVDTADALRGHNLALKLREHGYRVNFTLMFEPFQTQLALQAKPYFINTFLRHRLTQSQMMKEYTDNYQKTGDKTFLEQLREYMIKNDYLSEADADMDLDKVYKLARDMIEYRHLNDREGEDGLDGMRHNLRVLRNCNLEDTRLIVCSMEGPRNYPDIDKLLAEPEFQDMNHKVVITAEPNYLARFTSTGQVISYQRRFMNAVN
ncbi:MAG: transaldolase [Dorea sp.]|nr:transaldolase [Dorea sp.]